MSDTNKSGTFTTKFFKTRYLLENDGVRKAYKISVYLISFLLFIFAILSLVVVNALDTSVASFLSGYEAGKFPLTELFGTGTKGTDSYISWQNSSSWEFTTEAGNTILGGALSISKAIGIDGLTGAAITLAFVSIASFMFTLIVKKQTMFSFVSLGITTALAITMLTIFIVLLGHMGNDVFKTFSTFEITTVRDLGDDKTETFIDPVKLAKLKEFLQGLK